MYYAIRVEFQLRGSPHIHSFLWVLNAPLLSDDNIPQYIEFVDRIVKAELPDKNEDPELFDLVYSKYSGVGCKTVAKSHHVKNAVSQSVWKM